MHRPNLPKQIASTSQNQFDGVTLTQRQVMAYVNKLTRPPCFYPKVKELCHSLKKSYNTHYNNELLLIVALSQNDACSKIDFLQIIKLFKTVYCTNKVFTIREAHHLRRQFDNLMKRYNKLSDLLLQYGKENPSILVEDNFFDVLLVLKKFYNYFQNRVLSTGNEILTRHSSALIKMNKASRQQNLFYPRNQLIQQEIEMLTVQNEIKLLQNDQAKYLEKIIAKHKEIYIYSRMLTNPKITLHDSDAINIAIQHACHIVAQQSYFIELNRYSILKLVEFHKLIPKAIAFVEDHLLFFVDLFSGNYTNTSNWATRNNEKSGNFFDVLHNNIFVIPWARADFRNAIIHMQRGNQHYLHSLLAKIKNIDVLIALQPNTKNTAIIKNWHKPAITSSLIIIPKR